MLCCESLLALHFMNFLFMANVNDGKNLYCNICSINVATLSFLNPTIVILIVKCNLDQAKTILSALMKHVGFCKEKKNREMLWIMKLAYKGSKWNINLALPGFLYLSWKFGSGEDEIMDSDDLANSRPHMRPTSELAI
ncbi:hypothetical protein WN944_003075 [Citrus x changshan-huyou]|uniref:Uncharacterized protein n=1 Tax=Citrus x changshan-huyou TaxID=2935761 RepID=A0AAP0LXX1_9ROSI